MQTFDFFKTPVVPPHCLWVSGLLLESGSRASAGVPRLQRARHTAGNRLAMGDKVPGAWGAPGTDPLPGMAAGFATLWAGASTRPAVTAQLTMGCVMMRSEESLMAGAVSHKGMLGVKAIEASQSHEGGISRLKIGTGARAVAGETAAGHGHPAASGAESLAEKTRVMLIPKPDPWNASVSGSGQNPSAGRPISFCRRIVTFSRVSNLGC